MLSIQKREKRYLSNQSEKCQKLKRSRQVRKLEKEIGLVKINEVRCIT